MSIKKEIIVTVKDDISNTLLDSAFKNNRDKIDPKGFVKVIEEDLVTGKKKQISKSNLVVYVGRELLIQKLFGVRNVNVPTLVGENLYWLEVGQGGAPSGNPFNPTPPDLTDTSLADRVPLSNTQDNTLTDLSGGFYYKRHINSFDYQADPNNNSAYVIALVQASLTENHAIGYSINEAALYTSENDDVNNPGHFSMYSRITFPTILKTDTNRITFYWYLYF